MAIKGGTYKGGTYKSTPHADIPTDNLVLYLDAGNPASFPGNGVTWYDMSGQNNHATLYNGVQYYNKLMAFDGTNQYAACEPGFGYDFSAGITINVWARFATTGAGQWERLIDFGNGPGGPTNYNFILCRDFIGDTMIMDINANNDSNLNPGEMPITWDGWAMYTMYADGTYWKQYKNGQFYSYESNSDLPHQIERLYNYIGRSNWVDDAYFSGFMSTITIYNRALTEPEILQTFNAFKDRYGL